MTAPPNLPTAPAATEEWSTLRRPHENPPRPSVAGIAGTTDWPVLLAPKPQRLRRKLWLAAAFFPLSAVLPMPRQTSRHNSADRCASTPPAVTPDTRPLRLAGKSVPRTEAFHSTGSPASSPGSLGSLAGPTASVGQIKMSLGRSWFRLAGCREPVFPWGSGRPKVGRSFRRHTFQP